MKVFKNYKIYHKGQFHEDKILIANERIIDIIDQSDYRTNKFEGAEHMDGGMNYLVPGFIDIHIHGAKNRDVMDGNIESLQVISKTIVQSGVVGYLATTMTMSDEKIRAALQNIADYQGKEDDPYKSAEVLGVHLEGPFINKEAAGAQNPDNIQKPNLALIQDYLGIIKLITIAPEMDEEFRFIKQMKKKNIAMSIGHSHASYETCKEALDQGVENITHCFNGMNRFNHRKPGVVGAALNLGFTTEIIPDLIHTHGEVLSLLYKVKGNKKINIVTDAMRANFMPEGVYDLGGQRVSVKDCKATLEDGTIAGSVLKMDVGLRNFMKATDENLENILPLLTENPARTIGVYRDYGSIEIGKYASLVVLDEDYNIINTIIKGKV